MLFQLMQSLYYPAVLGTGVVVFIHRVVAHDSLSSGLQDLPSYYGAVMLAVFSLSFLAGNMVGARNYTRTMFVIDVLEVVCIFVAMTALGFFEVERPSPDFRRFYAAMLSVPALQTAWNVLYQRASGRSVVTSTQVALATSASFLIGFGCFQGYHIEWFNVVALLVLVGMTAEYGREVIAWNRSGHAPT